MKNKHKKTLKLIFSHPVSGNIKWRDIEALLIALGAELIEQESSRIEVFLFGEVRYFIAHIQVLILIKGQ
ncbi:MAG: hypothetical protein KAH84_09865 [Thiomargarita sp.]|nr:hypothetical protein [Thiomargarita sp.]